jgi:hypothetical protein
MPYTARLKTIHVAATRYAYGSEAAVTTMETPEATFETYITIKNQTYWYNEMPLKTAPTIEAIAIYESLRYITNVLGYRIIDINYPTLAAMVSAINKYNKDILLLHSCVNSITGYIESMYEAFLHLQNKFIVPPYHSNNSAQILQIITQVVAMVEEHRTAITDSFHQFMESKVTLTYLIQHLFSPPTSTCILTNLYTDPVSLHLPRDRVTNHQTKPMDPNRTG